MQIDTLISQSLSQLQERILLLEIQSKEKEINKEKSPYEILHQEVKEIVEYYVKGATQEFADKNLSPILHNV